MHTPTAAANAVATMACLLVVTLLVSPLVGCQAKEPAGVSAQGTVLVDGRPLSGAAITFEPLSGTTGPNASAAVMGGRFEVPASEGLHGGTYRVRVSMIPAEIRQSIPIDAGFDLPAPDAMIAPAFDADSDLTCTLSPEAANDLAFDVEFLKPRK